MGKEEGFGRRLTAWYSEGHRDLPWRSAPGAYEVWISEIMLQQTRAETVIPYYRRFLALFPDVFALADSNETELLKAWEGLGYYSRARNLKRAAREIVERYGGELPASVSELRRLPGIGDYTAGAIASIAFGIPAPAVDGNFERVFCRYFGISEVMDPPARKQLAGDAESLVPRDNPGAFANAVMELGATVCLPRSPKCSVCPLEAECSARAQGDPEALPVKPKKKSQRVEVRSQMLVFGRRGVLLCCREERLLQGLFVFPDREGDLTPEQMCAALEEMGIPAAYDAALGTARHVFTHIIWEMRIHAFRALEDSPAPEGARWADAATLSELPLPSAVRAAKELALRRMGRE